MLRLPACFALLLVYASHTTNAGEPLRYNFEPKQVAHYRLTKESVQKLKAPSSSVETQVTQVIDFDWRVQSVDKQGAAVVLLDFHRVQLQLTTPGERDVKYDSKAKESPLGVASLVAPAAEELIEKGFTVTASARGEVLDTEAHQDVLNALKNLPGAAALGPARTALEEIAQDCLVVLPEGETEKGQGAQRSVVVPLPLIGKHMVKTSFNYDGTRELDGNKLEAFKPAFQVDKQSDAPESLFQYKFEIKKAEGEALFNAVAGRLVRKQVTCVFKMSVESAGQQSEGVVELTSTLEEVDPKASDKNEGSK